MAAPTVRGRTAPIAGLTVTSPSATQVGDLILVFSYGRGTTLTVNLTLQGGWTEWRSVVQSQSGSNNTLSVAFRQATQAGAQSYTAYSCSDPCLTGMLVVTAGTYDLALISSANGTAEPISITGANSPDPPSWAPGLGTKDWLMVVLGAWHEPGNSTNSPTAPTLYGNLQTYGALDNKDLAFADRALLAASTENPGVWGDTISPTNTSAMTLGVAEGTSGAAGFTGWGIAA